MQGEIKLLYVIWGLSISIALHNSEKLTKQTRAHIIYKPIALKIKIAKNSKI